MDEKLLMVPLRDALRKAGRQYKATRAVHEIRRFVGRQTKAEVKLSPAVNEALWAHSREGPPGRIRVRVERAGEGVVVRLPEEMAPVAPAEKGRLEGLKGRLAGAVKEELKGGVKEKPAATPPGTEQKDKTAAQPGAEKAAPEK